ncbi:hypothetical protein HYH02_004003 [Chlamydomonas schloesseri]|uniref:WW domain-containing protein n=1 Tax=Chlamydomonas schloesseri TaxID=2026947 RepID=A0A836B9B8_9CHLO|nr:hypothetical protein HYH02_004003 [Chlamydomonas schloesseri]|eukprot:KAG2451403.1 hypothetical protein HYH02_004003 [Chlamydomonas schloesseri]
MNMQVLLLALLSITAATCRASEQAHQSANTASDDKLHVKYYFLNEVTGATQLTDPGSTPYEDEATGELYWLAEDGVTRLAQDPHRQRYAWIENYSPDAKRSYFFNQVTRESTWEKPADLAWRRLRVED